MLEHVDPWALGPCPTADLIAAVLAGEERGVSLAAHLDLCPACSDDVELLRAGVPLPVVQESPERYVRVAGPVLSPVPRDVSFGSVWTLTCPFGDDPGIATLRVVVIGQRAGGWVRVVPVVTHQPVIAGDLFPIPAEVADVFPEEVLYRVSATGWSRVAALAVPLGSVPPLHAVLLRIRALGGTAGESRNSGPTDEQPKGIELKVWSLREPAPDPRAESLQSMIIRETSYVLDASSTERSEQGTLSPHRPSSQLPRNLKSERSLRATVVHRPDRGEVASKARRVQPLLPTVIRQRGLRAYGRTGSDRRLPDQRLISLPQVSTEDDRSLELEERAGHALIREIGGTGDLHLFTAGDDELPLEVPVDRRTSGEVAFRVGTRDESRDMKGHPVRIGARELAGVFGLG